jgi:thiol-disulfide isomerase/thioredoxin
MNKILLLILFHFSFCSVYSQLMEVDSIITQNKITPYKGQGLILVDFWATWCGTCVPATRQLEIIQDLYPDNVFMISISDESNAKILKFLKDKPIKLMVVSDIEAKFFNRHNITNRPSAILMNTKGKILWQGKPGDLTYLSIQKYFVANPSNSKIELSQIVKPLEKIAPVISMSLDSEIINENILIKETTGNLPVIKNQSYFGTLKNFLMEYKAIPLSLIDNNEVTNEKYTIKFSDNYIQKYTRDALADSILDKLDLNIITSELEMNVREFKLINNDMLWGDEQIEWEIGSPKYMVGESRIEANSVSIKEIACILSGLKEQLYVYNGPNIKNYDWSFNYTIDKLMEEELENSFGIKLTNSKQKIKFYNLTGIKFKKSNSGLDID